MTKVPAGVPIIRSPNKGKNGRDNSIQARSHLLLKFWDCSCYCSAGKSTLSGNCFQKAPACFDRPVGFQVPMSNSHPTPQDDVAEQLAHDALCPGTGGTGLTRYGVAMSEGSLSSTRAGQRSWTGAETPLRTECRSAKRDFCSTSHAVVLTEGSLRRPDPLPLIRTGRPDPLGPTITSSSDARSSRRRRIRGQYRTAPSVSPRSVRRELVGSGGSGRSRPRPHTGRS